MDDLRAQFLLDPEVVFLNHGSFGAAPRPVFETYQRWQRRLEQQPVRFLGRDLLDHLRHARQQLAALVGVEARDLVLIPNATFGVNVIARSLDFQPGDEVLTCDHEYGACRNVWSFLEEKTGLNVVEQSLPLPLPPEEEILEKLWNGVSPRTRLIFLSQITSPTAVHLPVKAVCARAREEGILTLIDGAHAPGQVELDLAEIGAAFYTGNCHKWLLAPKGSAFLHVRPERQALIEPLVVSWGWGENCPYRSDSRLLALLEWRGTRDPAAQLSIPAAIKFQEEHTWGKVRIRCRRLLREALEEIQALTGCPSLYPVDSNAYAQMAAAELPASWDPAGLQNWLYQQHQIEIPVIHWQDRWLLRPSVQGYNTREDLEKLAAALRAYASGRS